MLFLLHWRLLDCVIPTSSDFSLSPNYQVSTRQTSSPAQHPTLCIQNWLSANKGDSLIHDPSDFCKSQGPCLAYHFRARCLYLPTLVEPKAHTTCCRKPFPIALLLLLALHHFPPSASCSLFALLVLALPLFSSSLCLSLRPLDWFCLSLLTFCRQFLFSSHVRKVDPRSRWQGHPQLPPYQSSRHQAHSSSPSCQPQPSRQALLALLPRGCFPQGYPR